MKWLNINVPLGVSETPIGFSRKSSGEGLSLIGSLFGTVGDYAAAVNTAQQNRWAQQEANESNERINESQLAWAREQYNLEKEENRFLVDQAYNRELENRQYNSPLNEMRRLRAAGLNPYLAKYGNGAAGGSGSISAPVGQNPHANQPNMIPMQATHEVPFQGFGLAAQNAANFYLAAERQSADIAAMKSHMDNETLDTISKIAQRDFQNGKLKAEMGKILDDIRFNRENWDVRSDSLYLANKSIMIDSLYKQSLYDNQSFINEHMPELHELQKQSLARSIAEASARIANINADTSLTWQQKATEVENTKKAAFERANLPKTLHNNNAIQVATYKQIISQSKKIEAETSTEKWRTVDMSKHSMKQGDRPLKDYLEYATDAYENVDLNNNRGFFRMRK